jgi:hypothetical protein
VITGVPAECRICASVMKHCLIVFNCGAKGLQESPVTRTEHWADDNLHSAEEAASSHGHLAMLP